MKIKKRGSRLAITLKESELPELLRALGGFIFAKPVEVSHVCEAEITAGFGE